MATLYASGATWNTASNWGTTSGASDGTVPTLADDVIFDANSISMTIDVNADCKSLDSTGYTGTLTQGIYTIHYDSTVDWVAGTFAGGSAQITHDNDVTISGGTYTNTSDTMLFPNSNNVLLVNGGTYNHNNGTIKCNGNYFDLDMNGYEVYHCISNFSNPSTIWRFKSFTVINGDFIQTKGTFTSNDITIDLHGDFQMDDAQSNTGSIRFRLIGTGDQDIYFDKLGGNGKSGAGFIVDKPSGTATFYDNLKLIINNSSMLMQWVQGNVVFDSTSVIWDSGFNADVDWEGGERIRHYRILKSNTAVSTTLLSRLDVIDFTNDGSGNLNGASGSLNVTGNIVVSDPFGGTVPILLTGTNNQSLDCNGFACTTGTLSSTKTGGQITLLSDFISASLDFSVVTGVLCTNEFDFNVDNLTVSADAEFQKTPLSTITYNSLTGAIVNVTLCDLTKPNLFNPQECCISQTTAELDIKSAYLISSADRLYWYTSKSAVAPDEADLISGAGAERFGTRSVAPTIYQNGYLLNSLEPDTTYYTYYMQTSTGGNSVIVESGAWSTLTPSIADNPIYARAKATALRLIAKYGQDVVIYNIIDGDPSDSAQPWKPAEQTDSGKQLKMAFFNETRVDQFGKIREDDSLIGQGFEYALMGDNEFEPTLKSVIIKADGTKLKIRYINKVYPAGDVVLYKIGVKR